MQKLQILLKRIAQAQASTENYHQEKIKDRTCFTQRFELDRDSEANPPYSFIACVAASTLIITFGLFCFTVRTFSGGGVRIEGPWGVRVEAQLGTSVIPEKPLLPSDRK
jgi:hypothetical protein